MTNLLFFISTSLIWGTTWYAVKIQGESSVSPLWSISYRFLLASIIFFIICKIKRRSLNFTLTQHTAMALQGIMLFSLSYICVYYSSIHLISGLLALICGSTAVLNVINERIWLGKSYSFFVKLGVILGVSGLFVTLENQIFSNQAANSSMLIPGIILGVLSSYCASLGNILSLRNKRYQLPVLEGNTFGMFYGGLFTAILAILSKQPITFDVHLPYIFSLSYLIIFGSVIAFQCFLSLVSIVGATRAGYIYIMTPLIAMAISTFTEGFTWKLQSVLGIILVIFGNIFIMMSKQTTAVVSPKLKENTDA